MKITRLLLIILTGLLPLLTAAAAPSGLSALQCQGSRTPYPAPDSVVGAPDSLVALMINHVGRHGARYATSPKHFTDVIEALGDSASLTPLGREILRSTRRAIDETADRWGQLDSLGRAEQSGIAARLCMAWPQLVVGQRVTAISTYVGRCVASMESFASTLRRFQSGIGTVETSSGRQYSPLLRFFSTDSAYVRWAAEKPYDHVLKEFTDETTPADRLMKSIFTQVPEGTDAKKLAADIYYVLSSQGAMGLGTGALELLSPDEFNRLWQIDNLRQYLSRTASTVSTLPADIAQPLLLDLIRSTDDFIEGRSNVAVNLRFGHAETLMPLLSLMRLPGCYYLTHYFDTVADHWQTWNVVPMASNLQIILFRSHSSGNLYVRVDLNERPMEIDGMTYIPWKRFRARLVALL